MSLADIKSKIDATDAYYLGRGEADDSYFAGSLDYIKFYFDNAATVDLTPLAAVDTGEGVDTDTADTSDENSENKDNSTLIIVLLAMSIVVLALVATALYMFVLKEKRKDNSENSSEDKQ